MKNFVVFILLSVFTSFASNDKQIQDYCSNLIDQSYKILQDQELSTEDKVVRSKNLLSNNLDLKWMSKFVLGRHRKTLTEEQLEGFQMLYSQYVIAYFSEGLRNYSNQKIQIKDYKHISDNDYLVSGIATIQDKKVSLKVDFLVRKIENSYKVYDIVTENISLITTHRTEFDSILTTEGFQSLMSILQHKMSDVLNTKK
jgi:phospholipid transport system substrate-binding protein